MKNLEMFKKEFKRSVLTRIIVGLKNGTWTRDEASNFAKILLSVFNYREVGQMMSALSKLSQVKSEILDVFIDKYAKYEEESRKSLLSTVRSSITTIGMGGEK